MLAYVNHETTLAKLGNEKQKHTSFHGDIVCCIYQHLAFVFGKWDYKNF